MSLGGPARTLMAGIIALSLAACGGIPDPPGPLPILQVVQVDSIRRMEEPARPLPPPRPIAPRVRWTPASPGEGTVVGLIIEPRPRSLPILELWARAGDETLGLARLRDGAYLALVPAPIGSREIPVTLDIRFIDGARLQKHVSLWIEPRTFPTTRLTVARRYTAPDAATLRRIRREQARVRGMLRSISETPLWHGPFIKPVPGVTTSPFGVRRMFNGELRSRHTGLDLRGGTGDPIYAANSGRVALSDDLFFNGGAVFLDHGMGVYTGYFHMSRREVVEGEWVEKGQLIGRVGATGRVTGPHLHWGLYVLGVSLDPASLLDPSLAQLGERLPPPPLAGTPWGEKEAAAAADCDGHTCY